MITYLDQTKYPLYTLCLYIQINSQCWKTVSPEIQCLYMEMRSGGDKRVWVIIYFSSVFVAAASSSSLRKAATLLTNQHNYRGEQHRRNLLSNGLGLTPPMGSLSLSLSFTNALTALFSFLHKSQHSISSAGGAVGTTLAARLMRIRSEKPV